MTAPADLKSQAIAAFNRYMDVWNFDDYWTRSNTFEAAIEFVTAARRRWPTDAAVLTSVRRIDEVIFGNITYFERVLQNIDKIWADDFGWCGNACLSARRYILDFPDTQQIVKGAGSYLAIADRCWHNMVNIGYDATHDAKPVPHGCSNNSKVSSHDPMKNTVTNATLFLLSSRLFETTIKLEGFKPADYLGMSRAQYEWFHAWFAPQYAYLRAHTAPNLNAKLIGERPIAEPDYENKFMWQPGLVWTGDQGLMLAALTEYAAIHPKSAPEVFDVVGAVSKGLASLLFDADGVLQEAPFTAFFTGDGKDYVCGRGVLLRHLSSPAVERHVGPGFRGRIQATNAHAVATWDANNQYGAAWNSVQLDAFSAAFKRGWLFGDGALQWQFDYGPEVMNGILQAAGLDALTAAMRVTPA
ncbi:hypothetical protein IC762_26010 [Bradyrhizobium genosp. L]|uniref:hypothetical protein n=1 Tax=Bradyrhizobium genosp. L TaxID=83637 RepID=UPI0018A29440|nr:hypothetical protein [Bradyrhizobium genosp. L]QPF83157.1 hypothetical protein IC762_26010 [Bradyrhizobium genosp. L]